MGIFFNAMIFYKTPKCKNCNRNTRWHTRDSELEGYGIMKLPAYFSRFYPTLRAFFLRGRGNWGCTNVGIFANAMIFYKTPKWDRHIFCCFEFEEI